MCYKKSKVVSLNLAHAVYWPQSAKSSCELPDSYIEGGKLTNLGLHCIPIGYYRKPISYLPELFKVFEVFWAAIIFKFILFLSLSFPSILSDIQLCGIIHGFPQAYSIYMITLLSISSSNAMWVHIVQSMLSVDTCLSVRQFACRLCHAPYCCRTERLKISSEFSLSGDPNHSVFLKLRSTIKFLCLGNGARQRHS